MVDRAYDGPYHRIMSDNMGFESAFFWFNASFIFALITLISFIVSLPFTAKVIVQSFRDVHRTTWIVLIVVLVASIIACQFVPHAPWQPNGHGYVIASQILKGDALRLVELTLIHGHAWSLVLGGIHRYIFLGLLRVYDVNVVISTLGLIMAFLLTRLLSGKDLTALATTIVLAIMPIRLRLAATETMTPIVEFFMLAALLYFALWLRTQVVLMLAMGLMSLALAMQCRLEFVFFGPAMALGALLAVDAKRLLLTLRDPTTWVLLLAFLIIIAPWVIFLFLGGDERISEIPSRVGMTQLLLKNRQGLFTPIFEGAYTPVTLLLPVCMGVVALLIANRKLLGFFLLAWFVPAFLYSPFTDCVSTYIRTAGTYLYSVAFLAGSGIEWICEQFRKLRIPSWMGFIVIALIVMSSYPFCISFLLKVYMVQKEYHFLDEASLLLPEKATIVLLSEGDDKPGLLMNRRYQRFGLDSTVKRRSFISVSEAIRNKGSLVSRSDVFFYLGLPCYIVPEFRDEPRNTADESWIHPSCLAVEETFTLQPVLETKVDGDLLGLDIEKPVTDSVKIGLYRITGVRHPVP